MAGSTPSRAAEHGHTWLTRRHLGVDRTRPSDQRIHLDGSTCKYVHSYRWLRATALLPRYLDGARPGPGAWRGVNILSYTRATFRRTSERACVSVFSYTPLPPDVNTARWCARTRVLLIQRLRPFMSWLIS